MHQISTPVTQLLGIQHPVMLAGMGQTSGAPLVAAVSNAGGIGVVGGVHYTPAMLREMIAEIKSSLRDPNLPFGVDLLLPQVGGSARKTNSDYTKGLLFELVEVMIEGGVKLFVSAVGVPPKSVVDRLHKAGVLYMNMVGHPKHVHKACALGADLICAQGTEAGGHTGDIPTSVLIPACADVCKQYTSPLTGMPVQLVAAGGIYDGRGVAAALMLGANAVWIGTRFVTARESGAPEAAKKRQVMAEFHVYRDVLPPAGTDLTCLSIIEAGFDSTIRSTIWSGRPLRALATPYVKDWEKNRQVELNELQDQGKVVMEHELDKLANEGRLTDEIEEQSILRPMGYVSALINTPNQTAGEIMDEIVTEAYGLLKGANKFVASTSKL